MQCPECDVLASKRDHLWRIYANAITVLDSCEPADRDKLKAFVEKSRIEFNQAATEFWQHQLEVHAVPN